MQPRDMFDIACVRQHFGDAYLIEALALFKAECSTALETAKRMDPRFAEEVMKKLQYRDGFAEFPAVARKRTIEILEAVRTY
jgi:hypothetical protein